jgi:hypothetical protein
LIHGEDSSHMTDECQTMHKQAYWMKEAWKNTSQAERSRQKREREQQKQRTNRTSWNDHERSSKIDAGHV